MFCNNCGKEVGENQKYCNNCGASIAGGTSLNTTTDQASPVGSPTGVQPAAMKRKRRTQAFAAVFAALTIVTMLLGWFSVSVSVSQGGLNEIRSYAYWIGLSQSSVNVLAGEKTLTATVFTVADTLKGISATVRALQRELNHLPIGNISDAVTAVRAASALMGAIKIAVITAVCAMLVFIFTTFTGWKKSALIGQIGGVLALLAAIVFAVSMGVASSSVSRLLIDLGAFNYVRLKISASLWVYLTMALGASDVVFIAFNKKKNFG